LLAPDQVINGVEMNNGVDMKPGGSKSSNKLAEKRDDEVGEQEQECRIQGNDQVAGGENNRIP